MLQSVQIKFVDSGDDNYSREHSIRLNIYLSFTEPAYDIHAIVTFVARRITAKFAFRVIRDRKPVYSYSFLTLTLCFSVEIRPIE